MKFGILFGIGIVAGSMITVQSVLNSALGKRIEILGSVLTATIVSLIVLLISVLLFPGSANFKRLPGPEEWYLYLGGILGILQASPSEFLQGSVASEVDPDYIESLLAERKQARAAKDWKRADAIRDELSRLQVVVEDSADGSTWRIER